MQTTPGRLGPAIEARTGGHPCPRCALDRAGYLLDPGPEDDADVSCGACGYSAPLGEYLLEVGAEEDDLWTLALSLGGA